MNKQLERDLQCSIQTLKAAQLANVLAYYEKSCDSMCDKSIIKKGMSFECEINFKGQNTKGYGRNQQQSISNATKNLLSVLIGKNIDTDKITKSLKYKNGINKQQPKQTSKKQNQKDYTLILDDISMIQPNFQQNQNENQSDKKKEEKGNYCDCLFYDKCQYQQNQIRHLQARVNLLSEENALLKKMLMHGGSYRQIQINDKEKQNNSYRANTMVANSKINLI